MGVGVNRVELAGFQYAKNKETVAISVHVYDVFVTHMDFHSTADVFVTHMDFHSGGNILRPTPRRHSRSVWRSIVNHSQLTRNLCCHCPVHGSST